MELLIWESIYRYEERNRKKEEKEKLQAEKK
jgi:hypothetical protein